MCVNVKRQYQSKSQIKKDCSVQAIFQLVFCVSLEGAVDCRPVGGTRLGFVMCVSVFVYLSAVIVLLIASVNAKHRVSVHCCAIGFVHLP
jgi:hypothetical protein